MPPLARTSAKDRTAEFAALVERLKKQPGVVIASSDASTSNGPIQNRANGGAAVPQSEFARKAALIGRSIHDTSQKLHKLAQLAKRTSMFDDPAEEIDKLTTVVKRDIQDMNAAIADLQRVAASNRDGNKQSSYHSTTVVDNLRSRLKDTAKEFKDVLTLRTDNLKGQQNRREMYSAGPNGGSSSKLPQAPMGRGMGSMPMLPRPGAAKSAHELFGGGPKGSLQAGSKSESTPLISKYGPSTPPTHQLPQPPAFHAPSTSYSQLPEMRRRRATGSPGDVQGYASGYSHSSLPVSHRYNPIWGLSSCISTVANHPP